MSRSCSGVSCEARGMLRSMRKVAIVVLRSLWVGRSVTRENVRSGDPAGASGELPIRSPADTHPARDEAAGYDIPAFGEAGRVASRLPATPALVPPQRPWTVWENGAWCGCGLRVCDQSA